MIEIQDCCELCGNHAPWNLVEGFPRYVCGDTLRRNGEVVGILRTYVVCRDCFELAYRGAPESNRKFSIDAQSMVLA